MSQQFKKETIPLHHTASGLRHEIDVWRYEHPDADQTVYLQGGLHGVELIGIPMVHQFMEEIQAHQLAYNFICVPLANPMGLDSQMMGLQTGYNNIHTNPQNCWNWNRIGNLKDDPGQEGNWIRTLLELSEPADISLDIHTAGSEMEPHVYCHRSQVEQAHHLGIPHVLSWENASHSFSDTNYTRGKVALTFEFSCSRTVQTQDLENGLNALRRFFDLLPNAPLSKVWNVGTQLKKWVAPQGGVLCWNKSVGEPVSKGETIATLYTREGKTNLASPYSGTLLIKNPIQAPHERQELAKFLVN